MTDYKNCTSFNQPVEESALEAVAAGIGFIFCLVSGWAVLALVSFN
jgi:hypothetical protein